MASPEVYEAFETRLSENWMTLPLAFENEPRQQLVEGGQPFVYVEIFGADFNQETAGAPGANLWQERGSIFMHVMVPSGEGSKQARIWAKALLALFREQEVIVDAATGEALMMPEMSIGAGQPGEDIPNYWALTATIHWSRHEATT